MKAKTFIKSAAVAVAMVMMFTVMAGAQAQFTDSKEFNTHVGTAYKPGENYNWMIGYRAQVEIYAVGAGGGGQGGRIW